jgi:hypothetical protein
MPEFGFLDTGQPNIKLELTTVMIPTSNIVHNQTTELVFQSISILRLIWY